MIKLPNKKNCNILKTRLENTPLSMQAVQGCLSLSVSFKIKFYAYCQGRKKTNNNPIIKPAAVKQLETTLRRNIKKTQSGMGIGFLGVCRKLSNWTQIEARQLSQGTGPPRLVLHQHPGPNPSCEQAD